MQLMAFGPACPECGARVPFLKTQFGLGKPFSCAGCGKELVVPRSQAFSLGFGMVMIFLLTKDRFPPEWGGPIGLLAIMVIIGLPITWAMTRVKAS